MAVEIIRLGTLPEDRKIVATCRHCATEFSFLERDATTVPDPRDGDYFSVPCPGCNRNHTVSVRQARAPRSTNR